ncbi:MAG: von Willebrand factor type A domain-containing protein [Elusimicrobiota bacterium]|nr:MAG: von Willebrand factor type A domain-containing protein [Elusimicrobiota bacterium]
MNEIQEAEKFSAELDRILKGEAPSAGLDAEMSADLAFAGRLARLDRSAESRDKARAKTKLLERAEGNRLRAILNKAGVRPSVLVAAAVLLMIGIGLSTLKTVEPGLFNNVQQMISGGTASLDGGGGGGGAIFGNSSSPYDSGNASIAVGGSGVAYNAAPQPSGHFARRFGALGGARGRAQYAKGGGVAALRGGGLNLLKGKGAHAGDHDLRQQPELDREGYSYILENPFQRVSEHPLSTFSIDVDGASYSNTRRILGENRLPPPDAIRIEEFINYFEYSYPEPEGEHPFSITTEVAACPWNAQHKLVRVGLKGKSMPVQKLPPNNLVFLIDTSGSMYGELPLVKKGLLLLVENLRREDTVAIVAYAGSAGLVLPPTRGDRKADIRDAIERLQSGGSTAGGAGIQLAYEEARKNFLKNGNNRVILATDGDFNVGVSSDGELTRMVEEKRKTGVFLSVLGFGRGNYQDAKMEQLANKGNGNYNYIDGIMEAEKVLVKQMGATLLTIAKDVKLQVEFNPAKAKSYRLIGYEDRLLAAEDFNDDKKDAGELGAGHTVTAIYEVVPPGAPDQAGPVVDPLKYQAEPAPVAGGDELLTVKFRYKKPKEDESRLLARALKDEDRAWSEASGDFKFAASAAGFGMLLRSSKAGGSLTWDAVREMAAAGAGSNADRAEMVRLIDTARVLSRASTTR